MLGPVHIFTWEEQGLFQNLSAQREGMDHALFNLCEEIHSDNQAPNPSVTQCQEASNSGVVWQKISLRSC